MHQPVDSPSRPFVPFFLNKRIWRYHFAPWKDGKCLDQICVEIPMKYYPVKGVDKWQPQQMLVTFVKKEFTMPRHIRQRPMNAKSEKTIMLINAGDDETVVELQYVCQCNEMYYDNYGLPVMRGL